MGVGVILRNGCGIQRQNFLELLQESELVGVTAGIRLSVYNVLGLPLYIVTLVQWCCGCTVVGDSCAEWKCKVRLFCCDIVNILLKTNGGRGQRQEA